MLRLIYILFPFFAFCQISQKGCSEISALQKEIELYDSSSANSSLDLHRRLYVLLRKCNLKNARAYEHELALAFLKEGQKDSAIYYSTQALKFSQQNGNDSLRIKVLTTLGMLYNQEGAYDAALRNYKEVYAFYDVDKVSTKKAMAAINMAQTLINLKNKEEASFYLNEALALGSQSANLSLKSYIYGISYNYYKDFDQTKATQYLRQSVNVAIEAKNFTRAIEGVALLIQRDSNLASEKEYIELIENHINSITNRALLKNLYVFLSNHYLNENDLSKVKMYSLIKDSIYEVLYQEKNLVQIAKLDSINNSIKAQNLILENSVLKKEKRIQWLLLLLFTTVTISLIAYFIIQRFYNKARVNAQRSKEKEISQLLTLSSTTNATKKQRDTFKKTLEFLKMSKVYKEPNLKIKELAEQIGVSPRHLSSAINNCYQNNFSALLNRFRVEEAKNLLIDMSKNSANQYSLEYVWEQCGFSNDVNFYRTFKKITGLTPTEYLNNHH